MHIVESCADQRYGKEGRFAGENGLTAIAEGVELEEQLEFLRRQLDADRYTYY